MYRLADSWVWDFWLVDDGQKYHLFFLYASRALDDPEARHYRASIGHAVSDDLTSWERVTDALVRSDPPAFDDLATWTGSIVRHPDGTWFLFYTGATLTPAGNVQTIGYATSPDLYKWTKQPGPILRSDPRWYELLADGQWHDEAFRDPWVMPDPAGDGWHMLITARANHGPADDRGIIGHARSGDLRTWELLPPLTEPGQGFGQLEVAQPAEIDGQQVLMFNCLDRDLSAAHRATGVVGGVWIARAESLLGPYDIAGAQLFAERKHYVGRLIAERETGRMLFMAFRHDDSSGNFIGDITDPRPVGYRDGRLVFLDEALVPVY
jgi:beta-fructofuranosidase